MVFELTLSKIYGLGLVMFSPTTNVIEHINTKNVKRGEWQMISLF